MGYNLHITRRTSWFDNEHDITSDEWLDYIKHDTQLRLTGDNGPFFVIWSNPSTLKDEWLDWSAGTIYAKYPSPELIRKMTMIAKHFNATVQGDDGEKYDETGNAVADPALKPPKILSIVPVLCIAFFILMTVSLYRHAVKSDSFLIIAGAVIVGWLSAISIYFLSTFILDIFAVAVARFAILICIPFAARIGGLLYNIGKAGVVFAAFFLPIKIIKWLF